MRTKKATELQQTIGQKGAVMLLTKNSNAKNQACSISGSQTLCEKSTGAGVKWRQQNQHGIGPRYIQSEQPIGQKYT